MTGTILSDIGQLLYHLETADAEVDDIKALIHENLNKNKEPSYLYSLVDFYISTSYTRCLEVLVGIREPHDKHLFDKLNDCLKGNTRQQTLTLLSHVVYKHPSWLYKISQHSLLSSLLKLLKTDNEIPHLVSAVLILVTLLPVIPSAIGPFLNEIFDIFTRLASLHSKKPACFPEIYLMHLLVGVYALFHRLYSMYPCHFIGYMRAYCSGTPREHLHVFAETIRPMLDYVRLHPLLVTASKELEISTTRWKHMETHDIVVECAKLSLDVVEGTREDCSGPRLVYPTFRPIQEVCQLLYPSHGFISPASKVPGDYNEESVIGMGSTSDPDVTWSPSFSCGLSTPPKTRTSPSGSYGDLSAGIHSVGTQSERSAVNTGKSHGFGTSSGAATPAAQQSVPPSPLRTETSPFKFTAICEHPSTIVDGVCGGSSNSEQIGTHQKVVQLPSGPSLNHVYRKLEEQRSNEREDLMDSEVATIIAHGPSGCVEGASSSDRMSKTPVVSRPSAPFQPRVVRVPAQWCNSPFFKSLQSAQRSRSFSQGKKIPRRATVEVAERRPQVPNRSHSVPNLHDMTHSTDESGDEESCGKAPLLGPSLSAPSHREQSVAENGRLPLTSASDPCVNYAHLLPSAFPQLPCPNCQISKAVGLASTPLFAQMSPSEILDRYIEGCRDIYSKAVSSAQTSKESGNSKGKGSSDEINILRGQVQLLHTQLLYERHKREIHAERNRRLLGKAKRAKALEEQNIAMKDQMQLQEKEIAQLSDSAVKYLNERHLAVERKELDLTTARSELKSVLQEKNVLEDSCDELEEELSKTKSEVAELQKDVEKLQSELFNTHHDLQTIQSQVVQNSYLKHEVLRLNKDILLAVELNQKYQERVSALQSAGQFEAKLTNLRDSHALEVEGLRAALESKEGCCDGLKGRVSELEGLLLKKDKTISEQKRLLKGVKEEYDEQVKAVDEKYESHRLISQHLEAEILKLHYKLEMSKGRSSGTMQYRPSSKQGGPDQACLASTRTEFTSDSSSSMSELKQQPSNYEVFDANPDVVRRRRASEPINIEPSSGARPRRLRREGSQRQLLHEEDDDVVGDEDDDETGPSDVSVGQEIISGALEPITSQSLASIVDFGDAEEPFDRDQQVT